MFERGPQINKPFILNIVVGSSCRLFGSCDNSLEARIRTPQNTLAGVVREWCKR